MEWEDQLERPEVLPPILRRALNEVERCLDGGAYAMATVASRRGLEALCRDQGVTSGNLEKKLARLHEDGKIDGRLVDWATHLRHVGNEGAHDLDFDPDRSEALDAQALLIGVLRYVYVDQARYEEAKRRWEYRQLPSVEATFKVVTYSNDCQAVYLLEPRETQGEGLYEERRIGVWIRHKIASNFPPFPAVDITHDIWVQCRTTMIEWLQVRNFRIAEWAESASEKIAKVCTDEVHTQYDLWDDEPPF